MKWDYLLRVQYLYFQKPLLKYNSETTMYSSGIIDDLAVIKVTIPPATGIPVNEKYTYAYHRHFAC